MKPGDLVLIHLAQSGGGPTKLRPALFLSELPGTYQNVLICGVSTRMQAVEPDWDELIGSSDSDFVASGLRHPSTIRLSYLYAAERRELLGSIGSVDPARLKRLLTRLARHLTT